MNKEEILEKSRKEKNDEGFILAENKGMKIGMVVFLCLYGFIMIFNVFTKQSNQDISALFMGFLSAYMYPKYKFTSNKVVLAAVILTAIASACNLISYLIEVLV